jgi:hypothetical protein
MGRCRTGISLFITRVLYRNMNVMWRYRPGFYMNMRAFPHRNKFICNTAQAQEYYKYIIMWRYRAGMYNMTSIILVSGFYNRALSYRNFFIYNTGAVLFVGGVKSMWRNLKSGGTPFGKWTIVIRHGSEVHTNDCQHLVLNILSNLVCLVLNQVLPAGPRPLQPFIIYLGFLFPSPFTPITLTSSYLLYLTSTWPKFYLNTEVKRLKNYNGYMQRPFPQRKKCPFGCNGYVTAMAVGQRQRLYSGGRMFTGNYLSSTPRALRM